MGCSRWILIASVAVVAAVLLSISCWDSSVVVLPGGHHMHMEQPDAVAAALLGFLRD